MLHQNGRALPYQEELHSAVSNEEPVTTADAHKELLSPVKDDRTEESNSELAEQILM